MPTRTRQTGDDRVGTRPDKPDIRINGICITQRENPQHDDILESLTTDRCNPFEPEAAEIVYLNALTPDRLSTYTAKCYYSSVWNLAIRGRHLGVSPYSLCSHLRILASERGLGIISVSSVSDVIDTFIPRGHRDCSYLTDYQQQNDIINISPVILNALAEEGILASDARSAVTHFIQSGDLPRGTFSDTGVLTKYCTERRYVVNRILNYVTELHESSLQLNRDRF